MAILERLPNELKNSYVQELSKIKWIQAELVDIAQRDNFIFNGFKLNGEQASSFARSTCFNSWTPTDQLQSQLWSDVILHLPSGLTGTFSMERS